MTYTTHDLCQKVFAQVEREMQGPGRYPHMPFALGHQSHMEDRIPDSQPGPPKSRGVPQKPRSRYPEWQSDTRSQPGRPTRRGVPQKPRSKYPEWHLGNSSPLSGRRQGLHPDTLPSLFLQPRGLLCYAVPRDRPLDWISHPIEPRSFAPSF